MMYLTLGLCRATAFDIRLRIPICPIQMISGTFALFQIDYDQNMANAGNMGMMGQWSFIVCVLPMGGILIFVNCNFLHRF